MVGKQSTRSTSNFWVPIFALHHLNISGSPWLPQGCCPNLREWWCKATRKQHETTPWKFLFCLSCGRFITYLLDIGWRNLRFWDVLWCFDLGRSCAPTISLRWGQPQLPELAAWPLEAYPQGGTVVWQVSQQSMLYTMGRTYKHMKPLSTGSFEP